MDRLPPLSAIRAFEAAGRHENFSRAAEELGLTQAAVSYQIRQLEDRVGKPLFLREKGRVRLSDTGRRLLPALTSGFAGIAEAFAALRDEDEDVLELNTAVSFGGAWLSGRRPEKRQKRSRGRSASISATAGSSKYSTPLAAMPTPTPPTQATPGQRCCRSASRASACVA